MAAARSCGPAACAIEASWRLAATRGRTYGDESQHAAQLYKLLNLYGKRGPRRRAMARLIWRFLIFTIRPTRKRCGRSGIGYGCVMVAGETVWEDGKRVGGTPGIFLATRLVNGLSPCSTRSGSGCCALEFSTAFAKAAYQSVTSFAAATECTTAPASRNADQTASGQRRRCRRSGIRGRLIEPGLTAMGKRLNDALLEAAKTSVDICITLIGINGPCGSA